MRVACVCGVTIYCILWNNWTFNDNKMLWNPPQVALYAGRGYSKKNMFIYHTIPVFSWTTNHHIRYSFLPHSLISAYCGLKSYNNFIASAKHRHYIRTSSIKHDKLHWTLSGSTKELMLFLPALGNKSCRCNKYVILTCPGEQILWLKQVCSTVLQVEGGMSTYFWNKLPK